MMVPKPLYYYYRTTFKKSSFLFEMSLISEKKALFSIYSVMVVPAIIFIKILRIIFGLSPFDIELLKPHKKATGEDRLAC